MEYIEYGYARKSSKDKKAEAQVIALLNAGISHENIFVDQPAEKENLKSLSEVVQPGDVLVIKSLTQLGYSYKEIWNEWDNIVNALEVNIRVLDLPLLDTSAKMESVDGSFVSDVFLQIISFAAQQERAFIKQRQADGIAYAKSQGKHLGRPRIPKPVKFDEIYDRWRAGVISAEEAMVRLNLKRSTFERFVKERKEELRKAAEEKESERKAS